MDATRHRTKHFPTDEQESGRVLIVDGDGRAQRRAADILRLDGLFIESFRQAEEAIAAALAAPPDLAILDLELPGLTGFEAASLLRADVRTRGVPILVTSRRDDARSRVAAFASGADCFLAKPLTADELRAAARSLAGRGRRDHDTESCDAVLDALVQILDLLAIDARAHLRRSADLAAGFGRLLGLSATDQRALHRAGWLHDIGKVGVPAAIVNKPGPLTAAERALMEQHPLYGESICAPLATLAPVLTVVRHHHEWWDGSGYPDGLAGEAIPYLARVFQVVDVYDALVSRRVYKNPVSGARALALLRVEADAGKWDPLLVDRFCEFVDTGLLAAGWDPSRS